jgi:hypothetical protein
MGKMMYDWEKDPKGRKSVRAGLANKTKNYKVCSECGRLLPLSSFMRRGAGYRGQCKDCYNPKKRERSKRTGRPLGSRDKTQRVRKSKRQIEHASSIEKIAIVLSRHKVSTEQVAQIAEDILGIVPELMNSGMEYREALARVEAEFRFFSKRGDAPSNITQDLTRLQGLIADVFKSLVGE